MSGALRGVPRRVGSGIKTGEAGFYGAREGAKPPPLILLFEFDFYNPRKLFFLYKNMNLGFYDFLK